ncbi:hypothetical protein EON81_15700 [bacterium]|nr:MAG: hypothetical protein EON81_15700 [bacterium]
MGEDRWIHFSYDEKDPDKGYLASAEDGIPDCWKTGRMKPGGLDLKALGCKVGRRDLVLEVQTFEDIPETNVRNQFDRVTKYFAGLPIKNPDGSTGVFVHSFIVPPRPVSEKGAISGDFDSFRPPVPHRGVVHWVQVFKDVGGVATIWGHRAQVNETWANVIHELGHNFGLVHEGYQERPYSPIYGSVMSYSYSYGIADDPEKAGYSYGLFKDHPLNERNLDEHLPFPIDKVRFLSGRPYRYHLKEVSDGTTLIDWNWNGVFGEKGIAADIDWEAGRRTFDNVGLGRANSTPVILDANGRLVVLTGQRGTSGGDPLSSDAPGKLTIRSWTGPNEDQWIGESEVEPEATGDASAAYADGALWTACPTRAGVSMRRVDLTTDGSAKVDEPFLVPATVGAIPTLAVHNGELRLLLWRDAGRPVGVRGVYTDRDKPVTKSETPIDGLLSLYPVGATSGGGTLWVSAVAKSPQNKPKWRLFRLSDDMKVKSSEWSAGEGAGRLQILWEADKAYPATGQTHVFARGGTDTFGDIWTATRIAYKEREGGWLQIHHDVGGAQTRSAPGVAFFRGDIAMAMWRGDNSLYLSFHARGIRPEPVRDYDDIWHIAHVGLQQSINVMER